MSRNAGRNPRAFIPPPPQPIVERPSEDLVLRQFARECINPAIESWENSGSNDETGQHWIQQAWFYLRELKNHPKLVGLKGREAALYVQKIYDEIQEVRELFEGDSLGRSDVFTFTEARWERIRTPAGADPLTAAFKMAMAQPITFRIERTEENFKKCCEHELFGLQKHYYDKIIDPTTRGRNLFEQVCSREHQRQWHELHYNPEFAKFLATVWNLDQLLRQNEGGDAPPTLILSSTKLATVLGVSQSTAWQHRADLEERKLLVRLPKAGPADRLS